MPVPSLLLALALAQAAPVPEPSPPASHLVPSGAPLLGWGAPTSCLVRADGTRGRAQCDPAKRTCLVAPDGELSPGGEVRASLEHAPECAGPDLREEALVADGYRLVAALAETPPGWRRDERQRVMQVAFDLDRRIWLGASHGAGTFPATGPEALLGVRWDVPLRLAGAPSLLRLRALETRASFDGDMADTLVAAVDASRAYPSPLLRVTTFVGRPRRFDPPLYLGFFVELARFETLRTGRGTWYDRNAFGPVALTLDLWRSRDLSSFVRLRGGAGYENVDQLEGGAWTPGGGAELDLGLDRAGLHHVRAAFIAEAVLPESEGAFQPREGSGLAPLPERRRRLTGRAQYEVVLLAINDQPITAVVDVRAQQRDDVPDHPTGWKVEATAGLRFNLFAPAPRNAPAQDRL